jgi:hypothetical protein
MLYKWNKSVNKKCETHKQNKFLSLQWAMAMVDGALHTISKTCEKLNPVITLFYIYTYMANFLYTQPCKCFVPHLHLHT